MVIINFYFIIDLAEFIPLPLSETMKNLIEGENAFRDDGGKIGVLRMNTLLEHRIYIREVQDKEALNNKEGELR